MVSPVGPLAEPVKNECVYFSFSTHFPVCRFLPFENDVDVNQQIVSSATSQPSLLSEEKTITI